MFVYFSNQLLLPSCFHHAALPQTGSSDGSGPSSDFLLGWGLPPLWDTVIGHVQGMGWVRRLLPLRSRLSSCLPTL